MEDKKIEEMLLQILKKIEDIHFDQQELKEQFQRIESIFDRVEQKLDRLEQMLDGLEQKLDRLEQNHGKSLNEIFLYH